MNDLSEDPSDDPENEEERITNDPESVGYHTFLSINLRLSQRQILQGPAKPDGSSPKERSAGLGWLDCDECERRSPGLSSDLKRQRGCHRFGLRYRCGDGDAEGRWRIDYTGDEKVDYCSFCPASLGDRKVQRWIYEAIEIEHPLGGLDRVCKRPIYHLPSRVVDFYKAALAARDRFDRELSDIKVDLIRG